MTTISVFPLARFQNYCQRTGLFGLLLSISIVSSLPILADEEQDKIITSHGISAFGDLKYPEDFSSFDYVNIDAPKGGSMSIWGFGTFDSLNPYIVKGSKLGNLNLTFDTLMTPSQDETDSYYGLLAETITYPSPSRKWVEFDLRENALFSDGTQVTADDVVFSFEMLSTYGLPIYRLSFKDVEKVESLGPLKVKFTFKDGSPTRDLSLMVAYIPVFSKAYFDNREFDQTTLDPIIASGPYVVETAAPGQFAVYRRRDDYWASNLAVNQGRHNFDSIKIVYYTDYTSAFEGFKGGDYDFREEFYSKLWTTGYDFPEVISGKITVEKLPDNNPSGAQGYWINLRRDKFSDPLVREAIAMVFNFEWSNKTLFYDSYLRTDSFWENSHLQASGMPSSEELALLEPLRGQIPESVFSKPAFTPQKSNPDRLNDRRVLRQASNLLDKAGWNLVEGIRQNAKGEALEIEFLSDGPSNERILNPYIENLKSLGVRASIRSPDPAQVKQLEDNFEFDITTRRYNFSQTPGSELRSIFGSSSSNQAGSYNISGVSNPAIDILIEAIENAQNREELNTAVRAFDRVLRSMHIWIPNWYSASYRISYRNLYSRPENMPPYTLGELTIWWFDEEKAKLQQDSDG